MTHILLSVHPKWAQLILSGEKTVEIRRTMPKRGTADVPPFRDGHSFILTQIKLYLYETSPTKMIVGEALCHTIYDLGGCYRETFHCLRQDARLSVKEMENYLPESAGYAFCLSKVVRYDQPLSLEEVGIKRAPQSWCYVNEGGEK